MKSSSVIFVVGDNGIIEKSLVERLRGQGFSKIDSSSEIVLNTTIQASVYDYFQQHRPEYVILSSVCSGGIKANLENPAKFIYKNLESQNNIVYASKKFGVKKLLYLGSSCVYPKNASQPIKEEALLTGELEASSEPYAISKIAGVKLCQSFKRQYQFNAITAIPATLYGPDQDMDENHAHVLGALMKKIANAAVNHDSFVEVWGSGEPRREFIYSDDFVDACLILMEHYEENEMVNIGVGEDISIKNLADLIARVVGFKGEIRFDQSKPDGVKQKLLDNSRIKKLGWNARIKLEDGIERTYKLVKGVDL